MKLHRSISRLLPCSLVSLLFLVVLGCGSNRQPGSLRISAPATSLTAGTSVQLIAIDTSSRRVSTNVTNTCTWISSNPAVATVSAQGLVLGKTSGQVTVTASFGEDSGAVSFTIGAPQVTALSLGPKNAALLTNATQQYLATATYANQTTGTVYTGVQWSVTPASVATISADGLLTAVAPGTYAVTGTFGSLTEAVTGSVSNAPLTSITVTPATATIASGSTQQFTATGSYSDGSTQNLTGTVSWSTSDSALLTVTNTGLATAQSTDVTATATIMAQLGDFSGASQVSVTPTVQTSLALTALVVTPTSSSVAMHTGTQLKATGYLADGTQQDVTSLVTWTTNNTAVSRVDANGMLRSGNPGASTVEASIAVAPQAAAIAARNPRDNAVANAARLRSAAASTIGVLQSQSVSLVTPATLVSLVVDANDSVLPVGAEAQLQATGIFSDGTKQDLSALATWQSSNAAVLAVNPQGLVTALSAGSASFTASFAGQSTETRPISVSNAVLTSLDVYSPSAITVKGIPLQLTVEGTYSDGSTEDLTALATFRSTNPEHIAVDSNGLTVGIATGYATIQASIQGNTASILMFDANTSLQSIAIVPATTDFALGTTQKFTAIGTFYGGGINDITTVSVWGSSNPSVLTVDGVGRAKSGAVGEATVTASLTGVSASSGPVRVTDASLTALVVSPSNWQMPIGSMEQFAAIGSFSDGTTQDLTHDVVWTTSQPSIASTTASGAVAGLAAGNAQLKAELQGHFGSTTALAISDATLVSTSIVPVNPVVALRTNKQLQLLGTYSDGSTVDLTACARWISSDPQIAQFNLPGLVQTPSVGSTTVTASCNQASAVTTVTSSPVTLKSIAISPGEADISVGQAELFQLVGTFSDGSTQSIDEGATWATSRPLVSSFATGVQHQYPNNAVGVSPGDSSITASYLGLTTQPAILHVAPKPVVSLLVTPSNANLLAGATQQFTAQGTYNDQTGGDLSSLVSWSSSNPALLSVDANGLATVHPNTTGGAVTVTATFGSVTSAVAVQLQASIQATLQTLTVLPTSSRLAAGTPQQLVAMGSFSDGTQRDLSSLVTWGTSDPTLATVNAAGLVTAVAPGTATLQAQLSGVQASSTVIIDTATLVSVTLSPAGANFANGSTQAFHLIGTFSDGSTQDLSAAAAWQSSNPAVAAVSNKGVATATGAGSVQVSATFQGHTASSASSQITGATLVSLIVEPSSPSYAEGTSQQFKVIGFFSDGTTQDLTGSATFQSSNSGVVDVSPTGVGQGIGAGSAQVTVSALGQTVSTASVQVTPATLTGITVTPAQLSVSAGGSLQFTAIGTFSDGTTRDLTSQVVWASLNPQAATVDQFGDAKGGVPGSTQFTATLDGVTVTTGAIQVAAPLLVSLAMTPASAQFAVGASQQFTLTGTFADGSTRDVTGAATWTSSAPGVATISASGLATGVAVGAVQFTASYGGQATTSGTLQVTSARLVSIAVTPTSAQIAKGTTQAFTATGTYSDGTTQNLSSAVTWSSSNPSVLSVNSLGVATGTGVGSAQLTASFNGQTAVISGIQVTPATLISLSFSPAQPTVAAGTVAQVSVIGTYTDGSTQNLSGSANYVSSNPAVATVSGAGVVTGVAPGASTITVTSGGASSSFAVTVSSASVSSIAITPATPTALPKGATEQFTATATFSDGTTQDVSSSATWSSSAPATASINSHGLATGAGIGSVQIQAAYQGHSATTPSFQATAAALASLTVKSTSARVAAGTAVQLSAIGAYTDGTVQDLSNSAPWSSGNQGVATVNAAGLATGVAAGVLQIQAQSGSLRSQATLVVTSANLVSVSVTPSGGSFPDGAPQQFHLIGTFSDDSHQDLSASATWTSSSPSVASISSSGAALGLSAGSTQFTGSFGGQSATTSTIQVTPATLVSVAITPSTPNFAEGTDQQFHLTGTYSDGSTADLTSQAIFSSSNSAVVAVSASGLAQGLVSGSGTISAVVNGLTATTGSVTVTPATLISIAVTPSTPSFANGTTEQFTAVGTFSDGTTEDLSSQVTWSSSLPQVATINAAGTALGGGLGSTQITAALDGVSTTTGTVQVTPATIVSLSVSPTSAQIAKGTTEQFTATGTFTDGTTQNLTSSVSWTTTDGLIASVSASGLATGTGVGSAQLVAGYGGQTASTGSFQVTPATLVSIAFNPASPHVADGTSAQVTVTGTFSDGSTQDLTGSATYSSSNTAVATVSAGGAVTGVGLGSSTITVQVAGTTGTFTTTVTSATLSSITISPSNPASLAKGTTEQFTATGHFSDGSTQNLSSSVIWGSTNSNAAAIDANGLVTGAGVGSAQISATYQGQSAGTSTFQVTPAIIASLTVTPASASIQIGSTQQFAATATYSDGTTQDVSGSASWNSSSTSAATISSAGLATGLAVGSTTVTAQLGPASGAAGLSVTAATPPSVTLQSIAITPATSSIAQGGTQQFTATGTYSDNSTQNLTTLVTWHSSSNAIATINAQGLATGAGGGNATISASYSSVSATATLTVSPATLVSIAVSPASATIAAGTTQQYQATGTFSDGSTQSLTTAVTWTSSSTGAATINQSGLATGVAVGSTTITAQSGSVSHTASLSVTAATATSIQISPSSVSLPAGDTQQLMVTATFSDGSSQDVTASATYATTNAGIASVNSSGLLSAAGAGSASVKVSLGSASATLPVTISNAVLTSVAITPSSLSLAAGTSHQLTATGTYSDGSTSDLTNTTTWSSSAPSIATVSTTGDVTVSQTGNATITATSGSVTASIAVTATSAVINSIAVSPASSTLAAGQTQQFVAIATLSDGTQQTITNSAHWSVSDGSKATVSNSSGSNGFLTSSNAGSITVMATSNSITGSVPVTIQTAALSLIHVTPNPVSLPAGTNQTLIATGAYTDGSTANLNGQVTWSSSSVSTASVNTSGVVHGVSPGSATVTATVGSVSGTDAVTVTNAVLSSIAITPASPSIALGLAQQLTATGTYTDGSTANISSQVQWSSASPSIATVSSTGLVSTVATGSSNMTATLGSVTQTSTVNVTAAVLVSIAVQSTPASFPLGLNLQLQAIGTYSDGTTQNLTSSVTWSSQTPGIGVVSSSGLASGVTTGTFNATATKSGITGIEAVTVTAAILQSITITPANSIIIRANGNVQFTATGHYSDGSTQDITNSVHWAITAGIALGTISQNGTFSPVGVGVGGVVQATSGSISGTTGFTVVAI